MVVWDFWTINGTMVRCSSPTYVSHPVGLPRVLMVALAGSPLQMQKGHILLRQRGGEQKSETLIRENWNEAEAAFYNESYSNSWFAHRVGMNYKGIARLNEKQLLVRFSRFLCQPDATPFKIYRWVSDWGACIETWTKNSVRWNKTLEK